MNESLPAAARTAATPPGNLTVTVPAVLFGPVDGLPAVLTRGHRYEATITVLPAQPGSRARASVLATGATVAGCRQVPVPANVVTRLTCALTVDATPRASTVTLRVVARGGAGTRMATAYAHPVSD